MTSAPAPRVIVGMDVRLMLTSFQPISALLGTIFGRRLCQRLLYLSVSPLHGAETVEAELVEQGRQAFL